MECPDCKRTIPSDSRFCSYCGESLKKCAVCERFFTCGAAFCGSCGGPLVESTLKQLFSPPEEFDDDEVAYLYELTNQLEQHTLNLGDNTIGAGGNNDIVVPRPSVSWNHAILVCKRDKILLHDSASTNGTFLNGDLVKKPRPLSHGDLLRFGSEEFRLWIRPPFRH